jgi:bile-acid 7alpha-dehydratase
MVDLERRVRALEDIEAIKQLKYRYWRCLDLKLWDEMEACFTADATASYGDGKYQFRAADEILRFLRQALGKERGTVTIHHGHHPEIRLTGPDTASGTWALYNYLFNERENRCLRMGAYYEDRYRRLDASWKLEHVGYRILFQEEWRRSDLPSLTVSADG